MAVRINRREREPKPDISPITSEFKDVTHPKHYTSHPSRVEAITICRHLQFNVGNAFKYVFRRGIKEADGLTRLQSIAKDLDKALWYLRDEKISVVSKAPDYPSPRPIHPEASFSILKIISAEPDPLAKQVYQRFLGLWVGTKPHQYLDALTDLERTIRELKIAAK